MINLRLKPGIGCYGDGAFGHQHTRERCAEMLESLSIDCSEQRDLEASLRSEMPDDAEDEYLACVILEANYPCDNAWWGWQDGDFGLWPNDEQ